MKLRKTIDRVADRYHVLTEIAGTSAAEEQLIADHGEPIIEVGGSFSGNLTRPGETAPVVAFSSGAAAATAVVVDGVIESYTTTNPGSYSAIPTVSISGGGGSGAAGVAFMKGLSAVVLDGGSGYAVNDTITLSGGTFATPVVLTVDAVTLGVITAVTVTVGGSYGALPSSPQIGTTSGGGSGAMFDLTWGLDFVSPTAGGSGYFTVPTPVAFEFPTKQRRLITDFPDKRVFDLADTDDADLQAKLYADTIEARIVDAVTALRAKTNPFEGETLTTI